MFRLVPKEESFFELFDRASANVHAGAQKLVEFLDAFDRLEERARVIKDIEHNGDQVTHDAIDRLNRMFITPLDRPDIHELVCRLDDILDSVDTAVHRMVLYKVKGPTNNARRLAACLAHATGVIAQVVPLLRDMKNGHAIRQGVIAIHTQENAADQVLSEALADLFQNEPDAREILKWKDVYQEIEAATDRCEDVANVLDGIVLKSA